MPLSKTRLWGAHANHDMYVGGLLEVPNSTDIRIWVLYYTGLPISAQVALPDARTMIQKGWPMFQFINFSDQDVDLRDNDGELLAVIPANFDDRGIAQVGLQESDTEKGKWIVQISTAYMGIQEFGPPYVTCCGSDNPADRNEVHTFAPETNAWTARTSMPAVGFGGFYASFGAYFDSSALNWRSCWRNGVATYEFSAGAHVAKSSGATSMKHSATSEVRSGSNLGILFISPKSTGSNHFQIFKPLLNSHTTPRTGDQYHENGVAAPLSISGPDEIGILSTDPPTATPFRSWEPIGNTVTSRAKPPGLQLYGTSLVSASGTLFAVGGTAAVSADPAYANDYMRTYDAQAGLWYDRPALPMRMRGCGVCEQLNASFLLGMGATTNYSSGGITSTWSYDEASLTYTVRGSFAWGKRDLSEVKWSSQTRF